MGMVQNRVTLRRQNSVGNGLCPVPLVSERRGGRSLQGIDVAVRVLP